MNWLPLVIVVANPLPEGLEVKMQQIFGWIVSALGWGAGIAFVAVGGVFLFSYFGGHGSGRAVRALAGVSIGCLIIFAGASIANLLTGGGIQFGQ